MPTTETPTVAMQRSAINDLTALLRSICEAPTMAAGYELLADWCASCGHPEPTALRAAVQGAAQPAPGVVEALDAVREFLSGSAERIPDGNPMCVEAEGIDLGDDADDPSPLTIGHLRALSAAPQPAQAQQPASLIAEVAANIRHDLDLIASELAKVRPVNQAHVLPRDTSHLFALLRYIEQEVERLEHAQQPAGGVPADVLRDAMRYRWLRQRDLDTIDRGGVFAGLTPRNVVLNEEDLDREVDAGMEAGASASPTPPAAAPIANTES